ncbi:single-stranded DNA-binding protein [Peptoniphilus sp. oral taxon 386]|uniref:single-stranded DNA-binding protein n=1 Tax=Peptoniphilus sp. oral taxon 386 TaxID=652713 RepID=UPI0001DA9A39|nr:single-stranded DNA-binding protein [Peptoniphilus sp. oral taxon 386]EFI41875.1 single-strand binding family protein [Peptoniphilus sp. oral taxon 386 str. F0131]
MNIVCLTGRLTRDPELRYTPNGAAVVRFTLAVDRRLSKEKRIEAESNNQQTADFVSCIAWNKTAELIANYLQKGRRIGVQGRIQTGSYERDGHTVYTTDVMVDTMEFLDTAQQGQQMQRPAFNQSPASNNQPVNSAYSNNFNKPSNNFGSVSESDDVDGFFPIDNDDIPF